MRCIAIGTRKQTVQRLDMQLQIANRIVRAVECRIERGKVRRQEEDRRKEEEEEDRRKEEKESGQNRRRRQPRQHRE